MIKNAFVTGGGTGIGKQIALTLLENGYNVAVSFYSSSETVKEVLEYGKQLDRQVVAIKGDISKTGEINRMFNEYKEKFDTLDLFVNNAGVTMKSEFLETTEEVFDSICNVDYKGAFFCMQAAARIMAEKKSGSIILISSNNATAHFADVSVYGSAKAAATKLAGHIAIELAKYNIRVNTIAPGWTDTGAARLDAKADTYYKIPLQKWVQSKEIADAVLYLASESAKSITGATLVMDNGALLVSDKRERYGF